MTLTPEELQTCWNQNRGEMLEWRSLEILDRRRLAVLRLSETPDLVRWSRAIRRAAASDFCTGKVLKDGNGEPFIAGPDWLLRPEVLTLIEEGKYDTRVDLPLPDSDRSPADLSYFNLEKDMRQLSQEEIRKLRICGLAVKAWERERREWYGQKRDKHGDRIGGDPRELLVDWAFGKVATVPGLVVNYGPPLDTPLKTLEEWMEMHGLPWKQEPKTAMLAAQKKKILEPLIPKPNDDVPF